MSSGSERNVRSVSSGGSKVITNAFGFAVGKSASKNYFKFASCFEPITAESSFGKKLQEEGFVAADPNGNGLCSLAELETFVLKTLVTTFPKTGKGKDLQQPGKDLFDSFRPCYMRAFHDAKDYKADSGTVIKGTKKATDDDYVSKDEFRLFCIYLVVYAAMFDAFSKIDGGGAGRSKDDDKRISEEEWIRGYMDVASHGFVALEVIESKKAAKHMFQAIDDNKGGIVLLDEWCWYLKQAEVEAGSAVGRLLSLDESGGANMREKLAASKAKKVNKAAASAVRRASAPKVVAVLELDEQVVILVGLLRVVPFSNGEQHEGF